MAKFKVGDKVRCVSKRMVGPRKGDEGKIVRLPDADALGRYEVQFDKLFYGYMMKEDELVSANSSVRNASVRAVNATFVSTAKDKLVAEVENRLGRELTMDEMFEIGSKARPGMKVEDVMKIIGRNSAALNASSVYGCHYNLDNTRRYILMLSEKYGIDKPTLKSKLMAHGLTTKEGLMKFLQGAIPDAPVQDAFGSEACAKYILESLAKNASSRNPVVANALAWSRKVACNALQSVKPGDYVVSMDIGARSIPMAYYFKVVEMDDRGGARVEDLFGCWTDSPGGVIGWPLNRLDKASRADASPVNVTVVMDTKVWQEAYIKWYGKDVFGKYKLDEFYKKVDELGRKPYAVTGTRNDEIKVTMPKGLVKHLKKYLGKFWKVV